MKQSVSVEEARRLVLEGVAPLGTEEVELEQALGRVLARALSAPYSLPPLDNTAMDGFAVRAGDVQGASPEHPVRLEVIEDVPAGHLPRRPLGPGQATRIMTGAPLPEGADAIVKVEDTRAEGRHVELRQPVTLGEHVRRAGEDVTQGETALEAGAVLSPGAIAMLASLGQERALVVRRPRVAIVATGDELMALGEPRRPGAIYASNPYAIAAQVAECGAVPVVMGVVRDDARAIEERLRAALSCDVLVSTGGVSVGDYDFVKDVLRALGGSMTFWRVKMKPGHPLAFGRLEGKATFGLPGNPVSCMVSFEQFVRPALLKMLGHARLLRPRVSARLTSAVEHKPGRTSFVRVVVERTNEGYAARPTGTQSSGALSSMVKANGLLVLSPERAQLDVGELGEVEILSLDFWQR